MADLQEDARHRNPTSIIIDMISGNCPVQAEGMIDGAPFYFRARGEHWSIGIGGDVVAEPDWYYEEEYPGGAFAAGWMSAAEARAFIAQAAERYARRPTGKPKPQDDPQA